MIRLILALLAAIIFFITGIITIPVGFIIGLFNKHTRDLFFLRLVQGAFTVIKVCAGAKTEYIGLENVPKDTPVLYVANHRSMLDVILTYRVCPDLTGFVAKDSIKLVPCLNVWMMLLKCIFLDRKNPRAGMQMILDAVAHVKNGISITIFPEGTRSKGEKEQDLLPFKDGSFKIASKTGCPVIPIAISGSANIMPKNKIALHKAKVVIRYGEPIYISSLSDEDKKHPGAYFRGVIKDMLDENEKLMNTPS